MIGLMPYKRLMHYVVCLWIGGFVLSTAGEPVYSPGEESYNPPFVYPVTENDDSDIYVPPKRGWEPIILSGRKRDSTKNLNEDKRGWDAINFKDLMDLEKLKLIKRGWEGLNFNWINGYNNRQHLSRSRLDKHSGRKRGWEAVDNCSCCRTRGRMLCCLSCKGQSTQQRVTTKSEKGLMYALDTMCKCCYATNVKDCCDICDMLS